MDNEKRYYIRCDRVAPVQYYGPYTADELKRKARMLDQPVCRLDVLEYSSNNWYMTYISDWCRGKRKLLTDLPKCKGESEESHQKRLNGYIENVLERKRVFESTDFMILERAPQKEYAKLATSNPFFSQFMFMNLNGCKEILSHDGGSQNIYYSILIRPDHTYYGYWNSFEDAVEQQKLIYGDGNRGIILEFKNGEWYYFPTEVEKGASKWEEGTVVPSVNTKDCTTSTTKTCTYTRLAVRQHGKTWN